MCIVYSTLQLGAFDFSPVQLGDGISSMLNDSCMFLSDCLASNKGFCILRLGVHGLFLPNVFCQSMEQIKMKCNEIHVSEWCWSQMVVCRTGGLVEDRIPSLPRHKSFNALVM